jgi:hypothetical protein
MKKINIHQYYVCGCKVQYKVNGIIDLHAELYASTGFCHELDLCRDNESQMTIQFRHDFLTSAGAFLHQSCKKQRNDYVPAYKRGNRIYFGLMFNRKTPIVIELEINTVWLRVYSCVACNTLAELAKILFNEDGELATETQHAIMRLNSAISLGDIEIDFLKPSIY